MQIYRKCTEAPPFRAISGGASRRKRGHRGSILPNNGLLQRNQPADRYKYCPSCFKSVFFTRTEQGMTRASWKQASFRHKISIVNYNYGGFQDKTISGAARRASIQRAVFPAAAEVADAGIHARAPSHIQPRIQRPGTWEVRCLRPDPAVSLFHPGGGCRVNQKIISCSLFMGKNNGLWQYARALFFLRRNRILQYL